MIRVPLFKKERRVELHGRRGEVGGSWMMGLVLERIGRALGTLDDEKNSLVYLFRSVWK